MPYRTMDPQHVKQHYESMTDASLLEIHAEDLIPAAYNLWIEELERRGLREAATSLAARKDAGEPSAAEYEHLERIGEFAGIHELIRVRDLLTVAGIPVVQTRSPDSSARHAASSSEVAALLVPSEHAASARKIIADFKSRRSAAGE